MKKLVTDALWAAIEPLLPPRGSGRGTKAGGRPAVDDRAALTGILFVLYAGLPWSMLLAELGCGSGMTCGRRLRDWQAAGVWSKLHRVLLERLAQADKLDWSRAAVDIRSSRRGRPPCRPTKLHADKGYDYSKSTVGWLSAHLPGWLANRRLTVRYERRADIHQAFLSLGCSLICLNYLLRL